MASEPGRSQDPPYGILLQNGRLSSLRSRRVARDDLTLGLLELLALSHRPSVFVLGDVHGWKVRGRQATPLDVLQVLDVFLPPEVSHVLVNDFVCLLPTVLRRFEVLYWPRRPTASERAKVVSMLGTGHNNPVMALERLCSAVPSLTRRMPPVREHTLRTAAANASCVFAALRTRRLCVWQRDHDLHWICQTLLPVGGPLGIMLVNRAGDVGLLSSPDIVHWPPRERAEEVFSAATALTDCVVVERCERGKFCVWSGGQSTLTTGAGLRRWARPGNAPAWWSLATGFFLGLRRLACLCPWGGCKRSG